MAVSPRRVSFVGLFDHQVLGTFRLIRGFADLRDLADISVPFIMNEDKGNGDRVEGHQRPLDDEHTNDIARYLAESGYRFLPEVILSVRVPVEEVETDSAVVGVWTPDAASAVQIRRTYRLKTSRLQTVRVDRSRLSEIKDAGLVRRIDGNHRLAAAETVPEDPTIPRKYIAPFCMLLLGPPGTPEDDYAESLIFHTLNSTALPLESEHALKLLLGQDPKLDLPAETEFAYSPQLHFTRLLRDRLTQVPDPARSRVGERPLTSLELVSREMLVVTPEAAQDLGVLRDLAEDLFSGLDDLLAVVATTNPELLQTDYMLPLLARVWVELKDEVHDVRLLRASKRVADVTRWLGRSDLLGLRASMPLSQQLLDIYDGIQRRVPTKIFLARWYPDPGKDGEAHQKSERRLEQLKECVQAIVTKHKIPLEVVDLGTTAGATELIHPMMYGAIADSEIVIVDLTGLRPNVCIEAGYALANHEKGRLLFLFQPSPQAEEVPWDLDPYRYQPLTEAADIPVRVTPHIEAILRQSGADIPTST